MIRQLMVALILVVVVSPVNATEFWRNNWQAPSAYETEGLRIAPLTSADAGAFLRAYNNDADELRRRLGWGWPARDTTAEQNAELVAYHQQQHEQNKSFTYGVWLTNKDDERRLVGALYIVPVSDQWQRVIGLNTARYDAELSWWLNTHVNDHPQAEHLLSAIERWLVEQAPWQRLLIPIHENHKAALEAVAKAGWQRVGRDEDSGQRFYTVTI